MMAFLLAFLFSASGISVDKASHSVAIDFVATGCGAASPVEFMFAGPESDNDYETMFLSVAEVKEIDKAFRKAGFPLGDALDYRSCRFWPSGVQVTVTPSIWDFVTDTRNERKAGIVFTGGTRDASGNPVAATNMPESIFAFYDCEQSLFLFDDALSQGATYGRFVPTKEIPKGTKQTFLFTFKPDSAPQKLVLELKPGELSAALGFLKAAAEKGEVDVKTDFNEELTIEEAQKAAQMLEMVDSWQVKLNGFKDGQFFYRSFLPLEKWRDRKERLTQPFELRLKEDGTKELTIIVEDWSGDEEDADPKLIVKENVPFSEIASANENIDTCLVFAPKTMRLKDLFPIRFLFPKRVRNYYIYGE